MAQVLINVDDNKLAAVAHAMRIHNNALPNSEAEPRENHADYCADEAAYIQRVVNKAVDSWNKNAPSLSRRQAFAGLTSVGLIDEVNALMAVQDADAQAEWAVADRFHRTNPLLNAMWAALPSNAGKDAAQLAAELDALFEAFNV